MKSFLKIVVALFAFLFVSPAFAQKVACANDFTSCVNGTIALPTGASPGNPTATAGPTAVNGVATTFMASDSAPAIQKGSSSLFGIVKVDGTSITASGGVISASGTVTAGGNNTFTGNNSFSTGTLQFNVDPTVSSGSSTTTGAIFFGTNFGSKYISYDPSTGTFGGYSLGSTFGVADTLYVGPIQINNGNTNHVLINPPSSGSWILTLPTSAGSPGQVLQTNGSGVTSWATAGVGTITGVTASTGLSGGGSSGTVSLSVTNPIGPHAGSGGDSWTLPGGYFMESGAATSSGTSAGNVTITFPVAISSGISSLTGTVGGANGLFTLNSCNTTTCTGSIQNSSTLSFLSGSTVYWVMIGH